MTRELTVIAHCCRLLAWDRQSFPGRSYLDIERRTRHGERRVSQGWWAGHVLASRLSKEHSFDLAAAACHPQVRALLLVEIVDHDLVLDVF